MMDDSAILAISITAMLIVGLIGQRVGYNAGYDAGYKQARKDRAIYDAVEKKLEEEK